MASGGNTSIVTRHWDGIYPLQIIQYIGKPYSVRGVPIDLCKRREETTLGRDAVLYWQSNLSTIRNACERPTEGIRKKFRKCQREPWHRDPLSLSERGKLCLGSLNSLWCRKGLSTNISFFLNSSDINHYHISFQTFSIIPNPVSKTHLSHTVICGITPNTKYSVTQ